MFFSTPAPKPRYVPITPKPKENSSNDVDDGYLSLSVSMSTSFSSNAFPAKSSNATHNDHDYTKQSPKKKLVPCTTKTSGIADKVPSILQNIVSAKSTCINNQNSDYLTKTEIALIQSTFPLCSRKELIKSLLEIPALKRVVKDFLLSEFSKEKAVLKSRKHGRKSKLMQKEFEDLKTFSWEAIVEELVQEFPFLAEALVAVIIPDQCSEAKRNKQLTAILPKIGMIYAILAQARNPELSRIQRCMSMLLFDSLCDQKVFDRLHPVGLCMSYGHSLSLMDKFGGSFNSAVIDAIKEGKRFRLIGDNINWKTGVHDERKNQHGHMNHAFGSAAIIQNINFSNLCNVSPQQVHTELSYKDFLLSSDDWTHVRWEYSVLISRVVKKHIPSLAFTSDYFPKFIVGPCSERLKEPNKVVPLPILYCNEQKYEDVVKIMDFYEQFIDDAYTAAGVPKPVIHTGGDQLTRERFSGAKRLRAGGITPEEKLEHLSPITFELFHLKMNYISLIFKQLYKSESGTDPGTMKCEQDRILRTKVNENVNENYDADRDFITSFVDAYIVEAVMDYFGMDNINSVPIKNIPPCNKTELSDWVNESFTAIVDQYVGKSLSKSSEDMVEEDGIIVPVRLADGTTKSINLKKLKQKPKDDCVKNYGHLVLELGLLFKSFEDLCKNPFRERGLRLLKLAMVHFKANNWLSKYAYEIMRFLVHQQSILSKKEAYEEFYGLFVNEKGGINHHIPCDLRMEFLVKQIKRNIKHMFSNKTEHNISVRTSVLPALNDISENYDKCSNVIVRAKKHSDADSKKDELDIINDLRQIRPFHFTSGRSHDAFPNINMSISGKLNPTLFHRWISDQKMKFATEIGV